MICCIQANFSQTNYIWLGYMNVCLNFSFSAFDDSQSIDIGIINFQDIMIFKYFCDIGCIDCLNLCICLFSSAAFCYMFFYWFLALDLIFAHFLFCGFLWNDSLLLSPLFYRSDLVILMLVVWPLSVYHWVPHILPLTGQGRYSVS